MISSLKSSKASSKMSKPISTIPSRTLNTFVRYNSPSANYYFTTDNNSNILENNPALKFKSAGCQEDTKRWGTIWTSAGNTMPKLNMCVRQKVVKVMTSSGELLTAIAYDTDRCFF